MQEELTPTTPTEEGTEVETTEGVEEQPVEQPTEQPTEGAEQPQVEEEKPCWEVNPGCGSGECTSICPAYNNKTSCWQFDWASAVEGMDDMSKAEIAKLFSGCPSCPIYQKHEKELNKARSLVMK